MLTLDSARRFVGFFLLLPRALCCFSAHPGTRRGHRCIQARTGVPLVRLVVLSREVCIAVVVLGNVVLGDAKPDDLVEDLACQIISACIEGTG